MIFTHLANKRNHLDIFPIWTYPTYYILYFYRFPFYQITRPSPFMSQMIVDWKSTAFLTSMPKMVREACDRLKEDGSNYPDWEFRIVRLIETTTGNVGYFDEDDQVRSDPRGDLIIRAMIEHSAKTKLAREIAQCNSAQSAMATIRSLFFFPSRHLKLWTELFQIKHFEKGDIDKYLHEIKKKIDELDEARFPWTKDSFLGIAYQLGVQSSSPDVGITLDARLRAQPNKAICAKEVEDNIRLQAKHKLILPEIGSLRLDQPTMSTSTPPRPGTTASTFHTTPPSVSKSHYLYNNYPCWICGMRGHWSPTCSNRDPFGCYYCGEVGHYVPECPSKLSGRPPPGTQRQD
ncbi:uncharacterized protein MELLADRAFT_84509 [Melampsora larici-populina 98AG31]|uniref:CCHC-type domain-containing protein n=1 Tax=Melampsora larici-populina (strain 98AG31 / pathotype 3-4-7) TaxID=747676 RepID=F4SCA2_MELLP|nr:uncharacterized protein MELLADRAFT_84509 [Melampsora larici-populina 98AG31]EGF97728.1 hypothetical protein MELLADRAFT_84509 [Melampsora larici-populina 98AG31]